MIALRMASHRLCSNCDRFNWAIFSDASARSLTSGRAWKTWVTFSLRWIKPARSSQATAVRTLVSAFRSSS